MPIQYIYKEWETDNKLLYAWFSSMYTRIDLILCDNPEIELKQIAKEIEQELNRLEKTGNYYDTHSELHRVNQKASINPVHISKELYDMIAECIEYQRKTAGCFDITIQSDKHDQNTIHEIQLSEKELTISFKRKGIRIDLSGYLKGYGLEKTRSILCKHQICNALVNMGNSSVMAMGNHPHGEGWKVGFNMPEKNAEEQYIRLQNECLTTSGNETRNRKHIIDPHTGKYIEGEKQISVITQRGSDGEALSTALLTATPEQRERIAANFMYTQITSDH